jgi:hypothetical protein
MSSAKKVRPRKVGRPPGRMPRPHIPIEGDTLIPKADAAKELGVCARARRPSGLAASRTSPLASCASRSPPG